MLYKCNFCTLFFVLLYTVCFSQNALEQRESMAPFNEDALLNNIRTLSSDTFEGRRTGTKGADKAKGYIIDQFQLLNVLPLNTNYEQRFSFFTKRINYNGTNILGLIKGTDNPERYIVISAHYDHEGIKNGEIYNGADDDASGIGALISFAEYFKNNPPKHSVVLAAFDAEELGLEGSKYYANNSIVSLNKIMLNLNMDMISRSETKELFVVGTRFNPTLKQVITNFDQTEHVKMVVGHDGEDGLENWVYSSDHASFHKKGIPFLYFGVDDHEDYHTPNDDYENIQPEFYKESVKLIIAVFKKIDTLNI